MTYSVPCECGKTLAVIATDAGTDMRCECGRLVSVPILSQLRATIRPRAYEAGTIDKINRMIRDGQLPPGDRCMICGVTTSDALDVHVQCESAWVKGPGNTRFLLVALGILFFPFWILWVFLGRELLGEERKELGCERSACAPLRICTKHGDELRRKWTTAKIKKLLLAILVYRELLAEFPAAKVTL